MKQFKATKLNILLTAIVLLLVFVAGVNMFSSTGAWLEDKDEVIFTTSVTGIDIIIKQNGTEITDNKIKVPTNIIEADTQYNLNVTITNNEDIAGYYVRFKAIALIDGTQHNINNLLVTNFYKESDGWAYYGDSTPAQMTANETTSLITSFTLTSGIMGQGKNVKLFLFIEGSATGVFT